MAKTSIKLSQALPALALAAAVIAPMPQALSSLSPTGVAQAASNPCAPSKKMDKKKSSNPCAPSKGSNPCAPSK